jgi:tRNA dimethylallyltransferase
MFNSGLAFEMRTLLKQGLTQDDPGLQAIGYREFFTSGENPYEMLVEQENNPDFYNSDRYLVWLSEVKRQVQRNTRHYAKRQITFFAPLKDVEKINADDFDLISQKIHDFTSVYLT